MFALTLLIRLSDIAYILHFYTNNTIIENLANLSFLYNILITPILVLIILVGVTWIHQNTKTDKIIVTDDSKHVLTSAGQAINYALILFTVINGQIVYGIFLIAVTMISESLIHSYQVHVRRLNSEYLKSQSKKL